MRLDVPAEVPALPAAVEVAAYRVATEALTNVARHARADGAVVRLRYSDRLEVSVSDDGPALGTLVTRGGSAGDARADGRTGRRILRRSVAHGRAGPCLVPADPTCDTR